MRGEILQDGRTTFAHTSGWVLPSRTLGSSIRSITSARRMRTSSSCRSHSESPFALPDTGKIAVKDQPPRR